MWSTPPPPLRSVIQHTNSWCHTHTHTQDTCCIYMSDSHDLSWSSISCLSLVSILHNISVTACDFVWHSNDVSRKRLGKLFHGWSLNTLFCSICCIFSCISTSALCVPSVTPLSYTEIKSNKKNESHKQTQSRCWSAAPPLSSYTYTEHALYFRQTLSNIQLLKTVLVYLSTSVCGVM